MLDLDLDPRLTPLLADALVREGRKAGVPLADIESMSYDVGTVRDFLASVREGRVAAFLLTLDRGRIERARRYARIDAIAAVARPRITVH